MMCFASAGFGTSRCAALCPEGSVERLSEGIVGRLARSGEVDHPICVSPHIHHLTGGLAAVIKEQHLRYLSAY